MGWLYDLSLPALATGIRPVLLPDEIIHGAGEANVRGMRYKGRWNEILRRDAK